MTSYSDIATLWATQATKGPKKAGNFWRKDREAGHWYTCIARIVDSPSGPVALILKGHWGTGTAAFINQCDDAAKKAGIPAFKTLEQYANEKAHTANLEYFEAEALACEAKIPRARSVDWQAAADRWRETARLYRQAFKLDAKKLEAAQ
ncbi:MAG: hypothetical protein E5V63_29630 [Mesorhizobium sp.]|nr:MAG: hypothetical protein E5V63_29630 [Mesorhizobium sp.]